jgi:hypothetical protein
VRSPITYCEKSLLPTFIAIAEYENPRLDGYGQELFDRMNRVGRNVQFLRLDGHNHSSIIAHFNTSEDILGRAIVAFFNSIP